MLLICFEDCVDLRDIGGLPISFTAGSYCNFLRSLSLFLKCSTSFSDEFCFKVGSLGSPWEFWSMLSDVTLLISCQLLFLVNCYVYIYYYKSKDMLSLNIFFSSFFEGSSNEDGLQPSRMCIILRYLSLTDFLFSYLNCLYYSIRFWRCFRLESSAWSLPALICPCLFKSKRRLFELKCSSIL